MGRCEFFVNFTLVGRIAPVLCNLTPRVANKRQVFLIEDLPFICYVQVIEILMEGLGEWYKFPNREWQDQSEICP